MPNLLDTIKTSFEEETFYLTALIGIITISIFLIQSGILNNNYIIWLSLSISLAWLSIILKFFGYSANNDDLKFWGGFLMFMAMFFQIILISSMFLGGSFPIKLLVNKTS